MCSLFDLNLCHKLQETCGLYREVLFIFVKERIIAFNYSAQDSLEVGVVLIGEALIPKGGLTLKRLSEKSASNKPILK